MLALKVFVVSNNDQNKLDQTLLRASHISQILLVLFAIFGYFYTVRPIHQNQVLSERISEKETQLSAYQQELDRKLAETRSLNLQIGRLQAEQGEEQRKLNEFKANAERSKEAAIQAKSKLDRLNAEIGKLYNGIYIENMSGSTARILSLSLDDFNQAILTAADFRKANSLLPISVYSAIATLLERQDPIIVALAENLPDQRKMRIKAVIKRLQEKYKSKLSFTNLARKSLLSEMQKASNEEKYELESEYRDKFQNITEQDFALIEWFFNKVSEEIKVN